jgi:hypothetical protein
MSKYPGCEAGNEELAVVDVGNFNAMYQFIATHLMHDNHT